LIIFEVQKLCLFERFPNDGLKLSLLTFPLAKEFINIAREAIDFKQRLE
jgi:hypothetical protein